MRVTLAVIFGLLTLPLSAQPKLYEGEVGGEPFFVEIERDQSDINGGFFFKASPMRYILSGEEQNGTLILYDIQWGTDTVGSFRLTESETGRLEGYYSSILDKEEYQVILQETAPDFWTKIGISEDEPFDEKLLSLQVSLTRMEAIHSEEFDGRIVIWMENKPANIRLFGIWSGYPEDVLVYLNELLASRQQEMLRHYYYCVTGKGGESRSRLVLGLMNEEVVSFQQSSYWITPGMTGYSSSLSGEIIDIVNKKPLALQDILSFEEAAGTEETPNENPEVFTRNLLKLLSELYPESSSDQIFEDVDEWIAPSYYLSEQGLCLTTDRLTHGEYVIPYDMVRQHLNPRCGLKFLRE